MSKINTAKLKRSRQSGFLLWQYTNPKFQKVFDKKNYAPGQHGPNKVKGGISAYGKRAKAARDLRAHYGIRNEKQFKNYFVDARKTKGNTIDNFIKAIETRLDMVVYRLNLAPTIDSARQLVVHGHIQLNGRRADKPGIPIVPGDKITTALKSKGLTLIKEAIENKARPIPTYLAFDYENGVGTLLRAPAFSEVPYPFPVSINAVIEYYSK